MSLHPKIAIVVVTHNRRETLLSTLSRLHSLESIFQVVVVDNASTDGTASAVRSCFPQVHLIRREDNIGGVARNFGVQAVNQPYVAFADDDSWWKHGSLTKAVGLFERHPQLGLLMSRILVGPEERLDPCCELMSRTPLPEDGSLPGYPILGFVACGAIVRRSAFLNTGGFNKYFGTGGEEALVAINMASRGWRLSYVPDLISHHHPSSKRDMDGRQIEGVRDWLWTAWLRRSRKHAVKSTFTALRRAAGNRKHLIGLLTALQGLPWVLRERKVVSPALEAHLKTLEHQLEAE